MAIIPSIVHMASSWNKGHFFAALTYFITTMHTPA